MASLSAVDLVQAITWTLYVVIFLVTALKAIRTRRRVKIDVALQFGALALVILLSIIEPSLPVTTRYGITVLTACLVMSLPYFLTRLIDDFTGAPLLVLRSAEIGFVLSVITIVAVPQPYPPWVVGPLVAYFVLLEVYGAVVMLRAAGQSRGVVRRRMQAVALGSALLGLELLMAGVETSIPAARAIATAIAQLIAVGSAISYYVGFAAPAWLRRAWQAPELRAAVQRSGSLLGLLDQAEVVEALEQFTANALGATAASIGIWDETSREFRFESNRWQDQFHVDETLPRRIFTLQRSLFRELPRGGVAGRGSGPTDHPAVLGAPITLTRRRLGVLLVFTLHAPIFADEDLELVILLADHIAVILENRALVEESTRERARAESLTIAERERRQMNAELEERVLERTSELQQALAELESFSYSVSHDLRAPLRTIDGFSQALLEDYSEQLGEDGQGSLQRIRAASQRMSELIDGLLRLSRITRGDFHREPVNLSALVRSVGLDLQREEPYRVVTIAVEDGVVVDGDAQLLRVAVENLVSNAWKFTGKRADARIEFGVVQTSRGEAYCIRDNGAGFNMAYADKLFGPFQRLHRRDEFEGTGIGLATVRRIVVRHGGTIWAEAELQRGATFYFTLRPELTSADGEEPIERLRTEPARPSYSAR